MWTTALLIGGWVPETSRSFHYWWAAPKWRLLPWLANPGNPAMSPNTEKGNRCLSHWIDSRKRKEIGGEKCMRVCENCWILDWCFLLLMPLNCIYLHLSTASLIGGWVPETFRSFHYWQLAVDGYSSHGWQILATRPWAPTTSWRTSELSAVSSEKWGSWQQMAMALRKIAQIWQHPLSDLEVRNYEYYTCYEICSATERMLSMSVSTMFFMRWSGMPHWEAVVADKILKLWPENLSGMPAVCSVNCKNEDRWACKKGWPSC